MNSLFQLDIPKRTTHCFLNGERLLPGMDIYSLILEEEKDFTRRDFCAACWTNVQKEEEKLKSQSYWKSKIEHRKPPESSLRVSRALSLLKELLHAPELQEAEIFVLCLFLSHARQLALRREFQKEGITYYLYEVLRQEEYLTIKALQLSSIQMTTIQQSLASQLKSS